MATAPQLVNSPSVTGTSVFYVAPDEQPNAGAAFLSTFLAERTKLSEQVFMKRLNALDPKAQAAEVAALMSERTRLVEQQAQNERELARLTAAKGASADDRLKAAIQLEIARHGDATSMAVANTNRAADEAKARTVRTEGAQGVVKDVRSAMSEAAYALTQGEDEKTVMDRLGTRIANAADTMDAGVSDPAERDAIREAVQATGFPIEDSRIQGNVKNTVGAFFAPPSQRDTKSYGAGGMRSFDQLLAESGVGAPASSSSGPLGSRTAGGSSGEIDKAIAMIDSMIAKKQSDYQTNPFGELGGFRDVLPGMDRPQRKGRRTATPQVPAALDAGELFRSLTGTTANADTEKPAPEDDSVKPVATPTANPQNPKPRPTGGGSSPMGSPSAAPGTATTDQIDPVAAEDRWRTMLGMMQPKPAYVPQGPEQPKVQLAQAPPLPTPAGRPSASTGAFSVETSPPLPDLSEFGTLARSLLQSTDDESERARKLGMSVEEYRAWLNGQGARQASTLEGR